MTKKGQDAHLYYTQNEEELRCINCHLNVGHYDPNALHAKNVEFGSTGNENLERFTEPARLIRMKILLKQFLILPFRLI